MVGSSWFGVKIKRTYRYPFRLLPSISVKVRVKRLRVLQHGLLGSDYTSPFATCIQDMFLSHFLRTFSQNVSTCVYEHICVGLYLLYMLLCIYLNIIYIDVSILYKHIFMYVYIYVCVCLYVCVCVYIL